MARSTRIYVVLDSGNEPLAAFTVKHECASWLRETRGKVRYYFFQHWWVCSFSDGLSQKAHDSTNMGNVDQFLEKHG